MKLKIIFFVSILTLCLVALWPGRDFFPETASSKGGIPGRSISSSEVEDASESTVTKTGNPQSGSTSSTNNTLSAPPGSPNYTPPENNVTVVKIEPRSRKANFNPLEGYSKGDPLDDLHLISNAMEAYRSLVSSNPRAYPPAITNAIFTKALTGFNPKGLIIVDPDSEFISEGELVDRWGNAIVLHYISSKSIGIRSAGADGFLHTEDDYHLPASEPINMIGSSRMAEVP